MELSELLDEMTDRVSDLHLIAGQPPIFRKDGELIRRDGPILDQNVLLEKLVLPQLGENHRQRFLDGQTVLVSVLHGERRFRMQVFRERGNVCAAIRVVPTRVWTLEELGFEGVHLELLRSLTKSTRGLIIVTGPTGSGKTTTTVGMIEEINRTRAERILTLENPIEYVFESKKSIITQQEQGMDFTDLPEAIRAAFFADPDVVFLGELNNLETVHLALKLAETGHLVFALLGSGYVLDALTRLVEAFPEGNRAEIQRQLSNNLQAVIAQCLVPRNNQPGRIALHEILIATPQVRQLIRAGQLDMTAVLTSEESRAIGMQTMDEALQAAAEAGTISHEMADSRKKWPSTT
jgi:twitching motility protein PilT